MNEIEPKPPATSGFSRRSFLKRGAAVTAALPLMGLMGNRSYGQTLRGGAPTSGDIAILNFLAAAELLETDLWGQYTELATRNPEYKAALKAIDPALPEYISEDFRDENSHAQFINTYLISIGQPPVDLDPFRTLPSSRAEGARQIGRLTNLTDLTVDTSYFYKYREAGNPDFGDTFPQRANIVNRAAIPTHNGMSAAELDRIAAAALFHFGAIENGGSSLYGALLLQASIVDVVSILGSIGPTEFYHLATFMTSFEGFSPGQPGVDANSMPFPSKFLSSSLAPCSILKPTSPAKAGALATVTALVAQGLFKGQSAAFLDAATSLAEAADAAVRS